MDRIALQAKITSRIVKADRGHETPCWISNRASHTNGYTKLGHLGKTWLTHRFAFTVFVGDIPPKMQLDHLCRVRACCNPDHLELYFQRQARMSRLRPHEVADVPRPPRHDCLSHRMTGMTTARMFALLFVACFYCVGFVSHDSPLYYLAGAVLLVGVVGMGHGLLHPRRR